MKYELEPDNRNCDDEILLNDLQFVAARLGKSTITKDDYDQNGRFCAATMQKRFGSWNKALKRSGLVIEKRNNIPQDELIEDLKRVAKHIGTLTVTQANYSKLGKFSEVTVARMFGSWVKALKLAGLRVSPLGGTKKNDDELLSNMAEVWEHVGRQPKQKDFRPPVSRFSHYPYIRRYGSWRKALEAFIIVMDSGGVSEGEKEKITSSSYPSTKTTVKKHRTPRNPGWRLRFLVLRRDNFKCCFYGPFFTDNS